MRQYARAKGQLAKTDPLDAQLLAEYGKTVQPRLFVGKSEARQKLSILVWRRNQLNDMLQAEKNRLRTQSGVIRSLLERTIACLEAELQQIDNKIHALIQAHRDLQTLEKLLRTAKSIGVETAATLLADLPELGQLDRQVTLAPHASAGVAALVGVAPMNSDTDKKRDYRKTKGGRPDVRRTLYMATLTGIRYNPILQPHYEQFRMRSKEKKVDITACMREMLTILNAMMRDQQPFRSPTTA